MHRYIHQAHEDAYEVTSHNAMALEEDMPESEPLPSPTLFYWMLFVGLGRRQQRTDWYYYYTYAY